MLHGQNKSAHKFIILNIYPVLQLLVLSSDFFLFKSVKEAKRNEQQNGNNEKALRYYGTAIEVHPTGSASYIGRAKLYVVQLLPLKQRLNLLAEFS
jgi:hypothetical protein